ncbi:HET-domain-containing protein [Stipitochalara longipes BDJ]|nr:HET-domain-containing protein [Stipitochalara longipes BDJ]
MPPVIYTAFTLDSARNDIRLLELAPGGPEDELTATLSTTSLDSSPPYETLSYVWGDMTTPRSIRIQSSPFAITKNLEVALRGLRMLNQSRTLWVDAICIDQDDLPERQAQVQLMRRIYSQSTSVLTWIGEEEEGDKEVFDFLTTLSNETYVFTRDCVDRPDDEYQKGDCETPMRELKRLIGRPWFFRAWTLQEVACGKDGRLHCGSLEISWEQLYLAYDQLRASEFFASTYDNFCTLCTPCRSGLSAYTQQIGGIIAHRNAIEQGRQADLLECVVRHRSRRATDPRDKVYAFLGLSATFQAEMVVPDYAKTIEEVYVDFAFQTLNMNGPRVLLHVGDCEQSQYQLPSWAPDWTAARPTSYGDIMMVTRELRYALFDACGKELASATFYSDIPPGVLGYEGVLVDSVLHVGEVHPWKSWSPDSSVLKQWEDLAALEKDPERPYVTQQCTLKEAFWRTILGDTVIMGQFRGSKYSRAGPEHENCFWQSWNFTMKSELDEEAKKSAFMSNNIGTVKIDGGALWESPSIIQVRGSIPVAVLGRRFFVTKTGYIGIGPSKIQEGDEIWVVASCKVPIIARKCAGEEGVKLITDDTIFPLYTLVGDCYVHGVMDGEKTRSWDQDKTMLMLQ